jgi:hypothetical protein
MCTVSYLPLPTEGFVLTSTRDEKNIRKSALPPAQYHIHGEKVIFPKDPDAGGTWIAASEGGYSLCLLNGGFKIHESKPPYRLSRGIVLLDFLKYRDVGDFLAGYDFQGIEPFTLLIAGGPDNSMNEPDHSLNEPGHSPDEPGKNQDKPTSSLNELRWDGGHIHHTELASENPRIWSSVTLYPDEVIRLREKWFQDWLLMDPEVSIADAVSFHKKAGTGDIQNDIMMNRDEVRTVSITSIVRSRNTYEMSYEDIISGKTFHRNISGERSLQSK